MNRTVTVIGENPLTGETSPVRITVPLNLPSNERADYLRKLWSEHVAEMAARGIDYKPDWKGPCYANVPATIADDVAEAMDFMGAIVDSRETCTDGVTVALFSRGYRAHGF